MAEKKTKQMVITTRRVDKFNTIRKRVELHPAICLECGEDMLQLNNVEGPFEDLPATQQQAMKECLEDHKAKAHTRAAKLVIEEEEIAGAWLGEKRGGEIPKKELRGETETLAKIKSKKR